MRIDLDRVDGDRPVTVAPGDLLVLRLPEQGSTGYVWMIDDLPEGTQVAVDDVEFDAGLQPGGGATRRLEFRIGDGAGRVVLAKRRPWEANSEVDRYAIDVLVRRSPDAAN